jgi:hypothetical protein
VALHQVEGCCFAVTTGRAERDLVCPCSVPRAELDQPKDAATARRWRINPDTLQIEPEDGQPAGTFTEQDLAVQQWPPCPVCGATIVQDFVDVHSSDDPGPVYAPGVWLCPNDCDPRAASR